MKKMTVILLCYGLILSLAACNGEEASRLKANNSIAPAPASLPTDVSETASQLGESSDTLSQESDGNILIAYFTWADNTYVENRETALKSALSHYESVGDSTGGGVDATTSASLLAPGNTARLAGWIQQETGGDLFPIVVEEPYSDDYDECLDRAADEKAANVRPPLTSHVEDMDSYDTVFIGFPNWWYSCPMAIFSFIENNDLSGKRIILFCAHGTGGLASSVRDITAALPEDCVVEQNVIGLYRNDIETAQPVIVEWLSELNFAPAASSGPTAPKIPNSNLPSETGSEQASSGLPVPESNGHQLSMTVNGQEFAATLYDTPAANSLYDMLPLELSFEDFNGIEKIAYLSQGLTLDGEPDSFDPSAGDLCLYAPWGNLSIFYQDFRDSKGLISLGRIDSGMDVISSMEGDFFVTLKKLE